MSGHQTATIGDTVYFWFAANDTSGSGGDGATPLYDVREAGAAAGAIPLLSGTPTLLTHANYPAGCHEIAVAATVGNGFAADDTFGVFCTLAIDSQNPSGFVGSCTLTPLAKAAGVLLSAGAITNASLAGNMEIVFETDFATNYNTTRDAWVTNYTDYLGTIPAAALATDCITAAKIAADAIGASEFAADAAAKIVDAWEAQSQADPTGFHVNVLEVAGTAQTANDNGADINSLVATLSAGIASRTNNANLNDYLQHVINVIESQRKHHSHISPGEAFYIDPDNGDTHANGARGGISDPYLTMQDCHDNAVTDSNHDMMILVPGAAAGVTTHTVAATTTISKRYVLIRGPGRDFIITRTGSGDTLALTGEGVEIEGVQIGTAATGSGNGVTITADFGWIHNCWINDTQGEGVLINQSENCIIEDNRFQDTGAGGSGDGVQVSGTGSSSSNNVIRNNIFEEVQGDSIKLVGGTINDTIIYNNKIHGSTGYGINVGAASTDAMISENEMGNNASGDITDAGTTTVSVNNEQWAKHSIATEARLVELDAANMPADLDLVLADTNELQTDWTNGGRLDLLLDAIPTTPMRGTDGANTVVPDAAGTAPTLTEILTGQLVESYAADGAAPTLTQALMLIQQVLTEFAISGTTITIKKLDGSTTAATLTISDASKPTSATRAT